MRAVPTIPVLLILGVLASACERLDTPTTAPVQPPPAPVLSVEALCGTDCVFGEMFTRGSGQPTLAMRTIVAEAGATYAVDIDDLGTAGADGSVVLNGQTLLERRAISGEVGARHVTVEVTLQASNTLEIRLLGKKGSQLRITVTKVSTAECPSNLPEPQLVVESGVTNEFGFTRYELEVTNASSYPDILFAAAPDLPLCGAGTASSRTWVDIFSGDNDVQIFGFCVLSTAAELNTTYFVVGPTEDVPSTVYITLTDRKCNKVYTSNEATLPTPTTGQ